MHETAADLVAHNFTLFFDLNTDGKHADYLHTIVMLSEPRGNSDYYDSMMPGACAHFLHLSIVGPHITCTPPLPTPLDPLWQHVGSCCSPNRFLLRTLTSFQEAGSTATTITSISYGFEIPNSSSLLFRLLDTEG